MSSSNLIILYGGLAITMLRGALIHEIVAQRASRRRLEHEFHLALMCILGTVSAETATAAQQPDSTADGLGGCSDDSGRATVASA